MNNGIMVPLDGSRFAEAALPIAIRLAERERLPLTLVSVWESIAPLYATEWLLESWETERRLDMGSYMSSVAHEVEAATGAPVRVIDRIGLAGEVLPELPTDLGLGLVVMSTHGRGVLNRLWLGSVADKVARKSNVPVLLVRPTDDGEKVRIEPAKPFLKILVPLDGSEDAEIALDRDLLIGAETQPVEVTLLRLLPFPLPPRPEVGPSSFPDGFIRAECLAAEKYMGEVTAKISDWNCSVVSRVAEDASPWTGIVDYAAANEIDLIAMATHGRGGASRLVMGSVAERVLHIADRPVLLFPPQRPKSFWKELERVAGQFVGAP